MHPFKILLIVGLLVVTASQTFAQSSNEGPSVTFEDFAATKEGDLTYKPADWVVWSLSGVGVASLGVGLALYSVGQSDEQTLLDAERDGEGRIRSITQRRAYRVEADAVNRMNTGRGFVIAGAVIGGAAALWYLYGQSSVVTPSGPVENEVVPFGYLPRFELDVSQASWQVKSKFLF